VISVGYACDPALLLTAAKQANELTDNPFNHFTQDIMTALDNKRLLNGGRETMIQDINAELNKRLRPS
jgi:hypothetical protein